MFKYIHTVSDSAVLTSSFSKRVGIRLMGRIHDGWKGAHHKQGREKRSDGGKRMDSLPQLLWFDLQDFLDET